MALKAHGPGCCGCGCLQSFTIRTKHTDSTVFPEVSVSVRDSAPPFGSGSLFLSDTTDDDGEWTFGVPMLSSYAASFTASQERYLSMAHAETIQMRNTGYCSLWVMPHMSAPVYLGGATFTQTSGDGIADDIDHAYTWDGAYRKYTNSVIGHQEWTGLGSSPYRVSISLPPANARTTAPTVTYRVYDGDLTGDLLDTKTVNQKTVVTDATLPRTDGVAYPVGFVTLGNYTSTSGALTVEIDGPSGGTLLDSMRLEEMTNRGILGKGEEYKLYSVGSDVFFSVKIGGVWIERVRRYVLRDNVWSHLYVRWSGTTFGLHAGGAESVIVASGSYTYGSEPFELGRVGTDYWDGAIDELVWGSGDTFEAYRAIGMRTLLGSCPQIWDLCDFGGAVVPLYAIRHWWQLDEDAGEDRVDFYGGAALVETDGDISRTSPAKTRDSRWVDITATSSGRPDSRIRIKVTRCGDQSQNLVLGPELIDYTATFYQEQVAYPSACAGDPPIVNSYPLAYRGVSDYTTMMITYAAQNEYFPVLKHRWDVGCQYCNLVDIPYEYGGGVITNPENCTNFRYASSGGASSCFRGHTFKLLYEAQDITNYARSSEWYVGSPAPKYIGAVYGGINAPAHGSTPAYPWSEACATLWLAEPDVAGLFFADPRQPDLLHAYGMSLLAQDSEPVLQTWHRNNPDATPGGRSHLIGDIKVYITGD